MLDTQSPCEIHRTLLAEYLALLEKVRAAQLERAEAGKGSVVIKPLLQELKVECNAARARYVGHRREHGC